MRDARSTKNGRDAKDKAIFNLFSNCVRKPPVALPVDPPPGERGSKTTTSRRPRTASALASAAPATPPPRIVIIPSSPFPKIQRFTPCLLPESMVYYNHDTTRVGTLTRPLPSSYSHRLSIKGAPSTVAFHLNHRPLTRPTSYSLQERNHAHDHKRSSHHLPRPPH